MKLVLQRVSEAQVLVRGESVARIGRGLLVLLGAENGDEPSAAEEAARKVAGLRIFEDENGKMNRDLAAVGGSVLVVSQFTLGADLSRGRRPGFERTLSGAEAKPLYERFVAALGEQGVPVATGVFGEFMQVSLVNDGPATFILEVGAGSGLHESGRH
jgi:D-aminoacyl-tRNA deacylase